MKIIQNVILGGLLVLLLYSCQKEKWDDYFSKSKSLRESTIMQVLAKNPEYSEFRGLIRKTGLDSLLGNGNYTVFAPVNGSFSSIDTNDVTALKKILKMHVSRSEVLKEEMLNNHILSVNGKALKFDGQTVNKIPIANFDQLALNGVVHEIQGVVMPLQNLLDIINTNPDFSLLKAYIDSSYFKEPDASKNVKIGYDTLGKPIYRQPIIYKYTSAYLNTALLDSENVMSTVFLPTNSAITAIYQKLVNARSGKLDQIVPRLYKNHGDTLIGNSFFIKAKIPYRGDSTIMMDTLMRNIVVRGLYSNLQGGTTFTNIAHQTLTVDPGSIQGVAVAASNGYYYVLNDITLNQWAYNRSVLFKPYPYWPLGQTTTRSPYIIYESGGTQTVLPTTVTSQGDCLTGSYTEFQFHGIGSKESFVIPFVPAGYYEVSYSVQLNYAQLLLKIEYGSQLVNNGWHAGGRWSTYNYNFAPVAVGIVHVTSNGPVTLTNTCIDASQGSTGIYKWRLDAIVLKPLTNGEWVQAYPNITTYPH